MKLNRKTSQNIINNPSVFDQLDIVKTGLWISIVTTALHDIIYKAD